MKMEPNNMENQFRDKLNKRAIKPSENAWDRLDAMLTVAEKPKRNYRWMYFAASFLGFILIATVFFNQTEEVIDSEHNKIVIEQKQVQEKENELDKIIENPVLEKNPEVVVASQNTTTKQKMVIKTKPAAVLDKIEVLKTEKKQPFETAIVSNDKNNSSSITNQKTTVKVDANALLASVENDRPEQAVAQNTNPVKVNSNDLLSQVDGELELSFRERVIKSVNKTYREVKVAVAKRNFE